MDTNDEKLEVETLQWLQGRLRWEATLDALRDGPVRMDRRSAPPAEDTPLDRAA